MTDQPSLPLTMPDGTALAEPLQAALREHSGQRFFAQFPEVRQAVLTLLKEGNAISEIARVVGPFCGRADEGARDTGLRKLITGLAVSEGLDLNDTARSKAAVLRDLAIDRASELTPLASTKELGALSMVATQAHQIERNLGGQPISITEERVIFSVEDFTQSLEAASPTSRKREAGPVVEAEEVKD